MKNAMQLKAVIKNIAKEKHIQIMDEITGKVGRWERVCVA